MHFTIFPDLFETIQNNPERQIGLLELAVSRLLN